MRESNVALHENIEFIPLRSTTESGTGKEVYGNASDDDRKEEIDLTFQGESGSKNGQSMSQDEVFLDVQNRSSNRRNS